MHEFECALAGSAESVRSSRDLVRRVLDACPREFVEDAMLVADELVTNAIRHGRPPISLTVRPDPAGVLIEVLDCGPGRPVHRKVDEHADRGRGLDIVDRLSDDWGVEPVDGGKRVWSRLAVDRYRLVPNGVKTLNGV